MSESAKLHFLGTGNAFQEDGRSAQALLIERLRAGEPDGTLLVDVGPTTLAALGRDRRDPNSIDAVFLTHLHGDHIAGWPFLLLDLALRCRRERPLFVVGPVGTRDALETLCRVCYGNLILAPSFPLKYREVEVAPGQEVLETLNLLAERTPVDHHASSLAWVFHLDAARVGVTGDTRWCDGLITTARRSTTLVAECTTLLQTDFAHLSLEEYRERRGELETDQICLVHLPDAVANALVAKPLDGVRAMQDGDVVSV